MELTHPQKSGKRVFKYVTLLIAAALVSWSTVGQTAETCAQLFQAPAAEKNGEVSPGLLKELATRGAYLTLQNGSEVFAQYNQPKNDSDTFLFLNGLPDDLESWDKIAIPMVRKSYGAIRYDFEGQGKTLDKQVISRSKVPYTKQVEDMAWLLVKLGYARVNEAGEFEAIKKVVVVGLSYGGGISIAFAAQYPQLVKKVVPIAPFLEPVEPQESMINLMVDSARIFAPAIPRETLYDLYFRMIVWGTYPASEPVLLAHPNRIDSVFHMATGFKAFKPAEVADRLPDNSLVLIYGSEDNYVTEPVVDRFYYKVPQSKRVAKIKVNDAPHRIPQAYPAFIVNLLETIIQEDTPINNGDEYVANPKNDEISKVTGRRR